MPVDVELPALYSAFAGSPCMAVVFTQVTQTDTHVVSDVDACRLANLAGLPRANACPQRCTSAFLIWDGRVRVHMLGRRASQYEFAR